MSCQLSFLSIKNDDSQESIARAFTSFHNKIPLIPSLSFGEKDEECWLVVLSNNKYLRFNGISSKVTYI